MPQYKSRSVLFNIYNSQRKLVMKKYFAVFLSLLLMTGCARETIPSGNRSEPSKEEIVAVSPSEKPAERSDDFLQKAHAMGYSDALLELLANMEIPEEQILNPVSEGSGTTSPDGRYILNGYDIHAFFACGYLRDTLTETIHVFPYWFAGYGNVDFIDEERLYVALPQVGGVDFDAGIRLYHTEHPEEPYAAWYLEDSSLDDKRERKLLNTYHNQIKELFLVSWCEIPLEWGGQILDDTETYRITLIDYQCNVVKTLDTGIKLCNSKNGIASFNFDKPNDGIEQDGETIFFDTIENSYYFNFETGEVKMRE